MKRLVGVVLSLILFLMGPAAVGAHTAWYCGHYSTTDPSDKNWYLVYEYHWWNQYGHFHLYDHYYNFGAGQLVYQHSVQKYCNH